MMWSTIQFDAADLVSAENREPFNLRDEPRGRTLSARVPAADAWPPV
jgi:hypothetical protein